MKKKNLLSLGALALSLGLVVSGCSTPGQKGETGETGPQGPQGEPGTPGADGKTYADVIVLNDAVEEGYHVTQDVFAVEVGSDESVTFTFTADEGRPFDVITVVINETEYGPIFASTAEDGTTTATLELTNEQVGNSAQLRRATFATAATYGEDLIDAYHDSIVEKDPQIGHKHDATAEERVELSEDYEEAIELFAEGYTKAKAGLTTELGKLEDDATVQDKIACADKYLDTAKKTLDDAYAAAVTAAKATAREALDDLAAGVTSTNYKEEDKTAQLTAAKGAVDAATTIAEIVKLVNETEVENKLEKGTYNKLYEHKGTAFAAVEGALEGVLDSEEGLDSENEEEYEALVAGLEVWGVSVEKLPTAVANEYFAKISEATEFETYEADAEDGSYKKGQVVLAVEGKKAVEDSLQGLKDQLVENIKKSYLDEVDNSKVITSTESKNNIKGAIGNAVDSWLNENKAKAKLTKYYLISTSSGANLNNIKYDGTLVEAIESTLNSNQNYRAFQEERLDTAVSSAKAKLEAKAKEIKDSDAEYAKAIYASEITADGEDKGKFKVYAKIGINETSTGGSDYSIANPFVGTGKEETNDKGEKTGYLIVASKPSSSYSVDTYVESLFDDGDIVGGTDLDTPFEVNEWLVGELVEVKNVYDKGRATYEQKVKAALLDDATATNPANATLAGSIDGENITVSDWTEVYGEVSSADDLTNQKEYTMDQVSKSAKGFATAGSLLNGETGLVNQYTSFVNDLVGMDSEYPLQFDLEINKTVYTGTIESALGKGYKNLKDGILAGTLGSEDVTDFLEESNLVSLYETDIESYATKVQDYLERTVRGLLTNTGSSTALTPGQLDQVDKNYEVAKGLYGDEDKYPCANITEIVRWYNDAITFVNVGDPDWDSSNMANLASSEISKYLDGVEARIEALEIEQSGAWIHDDLWNKIKATLALINDGELTLTGNQKAAFVQSGIKVDDDGKVSYNLTSVDGINEYFADVHKVYTNLSESAVVYRPISNEAMPVFKDAIEAIKVTDANKASIIDSVAEDILAVIDEWTDNDTKGGNAIDKNDIKGCLEFDNDSKPTKINIDLVEVMLIYTQKPIGFTFTDGKIGGKDALTAKGMEDVKKAFFEAIKGIDGVAD